MRINYKGRISPNRSYITPEINGEVMVLKDEVTNKLMCECICECVEPCGT